MMPFELITKRFGGLLILIVAVNKLDCMGIFFLSILSLVEG